MFATCRFCGVAFHGRGSDVVRASRELRDDLTSHYLRAHPDEIVTEFAAFQQLID